MFNRLIVSSVFAALAFAPQAHGQSGLDFIVAAEETKTLESGMYEFRNVQIMNGGKLVLKGGVTIASESFSSDNGAQIEYASNSSAQENISISTFDASGLRFLYISANGKSGADISGQASAGGKGRDAYKISHSISYPGGRDCHRGGGGAKGATGEGGHHAANVGLHLPNLKVGSLLRIHANGGSGGKGQTGGSGGLGGEGAAGHPACDGGAGGAGGNGGRAGDAGKISVYLVVADDASESDKEEAFKTLRLEYANNSGTPGAPGNGGSGGSGGRGAVFGGDGTSGSGGSLGAGGSQGGTATSSLTEPGKHWTVTSVLTQSKYALQYTQTLQRIRQAMAQGE